MSMKLHDQFQDKFARLFDRQMFEKNPRLSAIIDDMESRYGASLSDDSLEHVSAAGETRPSDMKEGTSK